jgi:hypothetical protein
MRAVDHLTVEADDAGSGRGGEESQHALGSRYLEIRGGERYVDRLDLIRVNGEFAGEAIPARTLEFALETRSVAEIDVHTINRLYSNRNGS